MKPFLSILFAVLAPIASLFAQVPGRNVQANGATNALKWPAAANFRSANSISAAFSTSAELRGLLSDETGSGAAVFAGGNIGAATATSLNGLTITTTTGTLTMTNGKTLAVTNTLTLSGTDGSTLNIGGGGTLGTSAYTAATAYQAASANLTTFSGIAPSANVQTFLGAADYAAGRAALGISTQYVAIAADTVVVTNSTTPTSAMAVTLGVGTWDVEIYYSCLSSAFASAGCDIFPLFTGTETESGVMILSSSSAAANVDYTTPNLFPPFYAAIDGQGSFQYGGQSAWAIYRGRITVTVAGDLIIRMSQHTAVPGETVKIGKNSYIRAVKAP